MNFPILFVVTLSHFAYFIFYFFSLFLLFTHKPITLFDPLPSKTYIKLALIPHEKEQAAQRLVQERAHLTEDERKRLEKAERRAANKAKRSEEKKSAAEEKEDKSDGLQEMHKQGETDSDMYGKELAATTKPLDDVTKYVQYLQDFLGHELESQTLAAEVYILKKKYLLALRAIQRGAAIDASSPDVFRLAVRLFAEFDKLDDASTHAVVKEVVADARKTLLGGALVDLKSATEAFLKNNAQSQAHRVAYTSASSTLGAELDVKVLTDLSGVCTWQTCERVLNILSINGVASATVECYKSACHELFPKTAAFMTEDQLTAVKEAQGAAVPKVEETK